MKDWTEKGVLDLSFDDKVEMIEAFSNSLAELHVASVNSNKKAVELIAKTLIETFAIIIMGDEAIEIESKLLEFENNISNRLRAEA